MSLRKTLFACAVLALKVSASDVYSAVSGLPAGGVAINNAPGVNAPRGGPLPPANGTYTLTAFAHDSLVAPDVTNKTPPTKYVINPQNPNQTDQKDADANGVAFDAYSLAQINYSRAGGWNSNGSYASVCGPVSAANPGGNKANCGNNPNGENAKATATVTDPWSFAAQSADLTFEQIVTFSDGLSLEAFATGADFAAAGIIAEETTDLDNLGMLWELIWSTDSTHPGVSEVTFWSNPILGLDDAAITSSFDLLLSGDPTTGLSMLTQTFSFDYQLTIPANTVAEFSSSVMYGADGSTGAPEPSTFLMAILGATFLVAGKVRTMTRSMIQ
jgi:hypothetical protein